MKGKPQLFGTDGVRGVAGEYPLDRDTVGKLGIALSRVLRRPGGRRPLRVLLGEDTRESSSWISRLLASGLKSAGAEIVYAGVITTPGVAFLTHHHHFAAGIVVSASHNPYDDNGIKVFSGAGVKLAEAVELEIERELEKIGTDTVAEQALEADPSLLRDYVERLASLVEGGSGVAPRHLVIDCANGAASHVVPPLLDRLGISASVFHAQPSGQNINLHCGSLHPESMAKETHLRRADLGVAFDGDADRAIFATPDGRIVDGDHVLYAVAPFLQRQNLLKGESVVGTWMTNLGLEIGLARVGIGLKRVAVGDKYVLEEMLRSGINLGGEPSGHIIFSDISLAGDGLITLLEVLRVVAATGQSLQALVGGLKQFPQVIRNVRVKARQPLDSIAEVTTAIEACRRDFGDRGRTVVRYSGTEPLVRVMVEGEIAREVEHHAAEIAGAVRQALGV
jgi:phosphoglucosamine mutase